MTTKLLKGDKKREGRLTMHTIKGKTLLLVALVAVSVLALMTGCVRVTVNGGNEVVGSPNLVTKEFDFSGFTRVEVGSAFEVDVTRSPSYRVSITVNENLFDYLDVSQKGDTLTIRLEPHYNYSRTSQEATITLPDLYGLKLSGATRGKVKGFSFSHPLELGLSGASSLDIDNLEAGDTQFDISGASKALGSIKMANSRFVVSGASTVELEGFATDASIKISGASHVRLADFRVMDVTVNLSGASDATINASGRLDVNLSGASRLKYIGNPTLRDINVSGGSTMSQK